MYAYGSDASVGAGLVRPHWVGHSVTNEDVDELCAPACMYVMVILVYVLSSAGARVGVGCATALLDLDSPGDDLTNDSDY